jgi:hypothetical protein
MLYEDAFLDKVEFSAKTYADFQGGGNDVKECVAGYPILKHLSIPVGLFMRPFPVANIINADPITNVMESEKYEALYEKTLDTHKGRKTRREVRSVTNKRLTKRLT